MGKMKIGDLFTLEKGSLQSSKCTEGEYDFITAAKKWKTHNIYSHEMEALIFAAMASGSLGRTHYVNGKFITSDLCYIMVPKDNKKYPIDLKFYHFVFNSLRDEIVKNTKSGTSKESINQTNLKNYEIPYFDIEQQQLWIEKLINTKSIKENLVTEIQVQQTLLKKLRQSILQEAIEGKLTEKWREENPDIESVSTLLEKIKVEKEQLLKDQKIKKQKPILPITEDEIPFDIPKNWEFCRWEELLSPEQHSMKRGPFGSALTKDIFVKEGIKVYEQQNAIHDVNRERYFITQEKFKEMEAFTVKPYDLIISCSGATLGRISELHEHSKIGIINQALLKINLNNKLISNSFFIKIFRSSSFQTLILTKAWGSAMPNMVGVKELKKLLLPLPPREEQNKILEKLEYLFKICDELEVEINRSKINSETLVSSVLKEASEE